MPAIPLNALGRAYLTFAPPWSRRMFTIRTLATPKGIIPPKLKPFIPSKGTAPLAALRAMKGIAVSGGNAQTQRKYAKSGKRPSRTLSQILGE